VYEYVGLFHDKIVLGALYIRYVTDMVRLLNFLHRKCSLSID